MTGPLCPGELELARAHSTGAGAALEAHLASCGACRTAWRGTASAIELARELPSELPSSVHREEMRTALLARAGGAVLDATIAPTARPARKYAVALAAVAATAAIVHVFVRTPAPPPGAGTRRERGAEAPVTARGSVHPHAGARYELAARLPDERVRLHDGTIDVDVEPLAAGERFRVLVGGAEVEVHGTSFEVTASDDQLVAVRVERGRVEVRPLGHAPTVLAAGETWRPQPQVDEAVAPAPAPPPAHTPPARHVTIRVAPAPTPPAPPAAAARSERLPEEIAYDDAWNAMRAGAFHDSSAAFARALALAPEGSLADDARYWRAVSLAREHRVADAMSAFRELLDEHTAGAHRGEASVMLGWLLVDAHEVTEAKARFTAALHDADARVARSAQAGLAALR